MERLLEKLQGEYKELQQAQEYLFYLMCSSVVLGKISLDLDIPLSQFLSLICLIISNNSRQFILEERNKIQERIQRILPNP